MNCVVITRNGKGEVWGFDSLRAARLHPIPQSWDVFATTPDELIRQFSRSEIETYFVKHFEGRDRTRLIHAIEEWKAGRPSAVLPQDVRELLWDKVNEFCSEPPAAPEEVLRIIVEDRKAVEGATMVSRPDGDSIPRVPKSQGEDDMGDKREVFRMADEGVITIGTDKEGKKYSAENNPKKGDKTSANFAKYKDGMTVKDALASGLTRSNVRRDRRAGLIGIVNPPEAPKPAADAKASGDGAAGSADAKATGTGKPQLASS